MAFRKEIFGDTKPTSYQESIRRALDHQIKTGRFIDKEDYLDSAGMVAVESFDELNPMRWLDPEGIPGVTPRQVMIQAALLDLNNDEEVDLKNMARTEDILEPDNRHLKSYGYHHVKEVVNNKLVEIREKYPTLPDHPKSFAELTECNLLTYALNNYATFGELAEDLRQRLGKSQKAFARDDLGCTSFQGYQTLKVPRTAIQRAMKKQEVEFNAGLIKRLGAKNEAEEIEWRKLIVGIPHYMNQDMLNQCFTKPLPGVAVDPHKITVDTDVVGHGHENAASTFFTLLMHRHGLVNYHQLAQKIVVDMKLAHTHEELLYRAISQLSAGKTRTIEPELAEIIENFAFPGKALAAQRGTCRKFLTAERYYRPTHDLTTQATPDWLPFKRGDAILDTSSIVLHFPHDPQTGTELQGKALLEYAIAKPSSISELLEEIRALSRLHVREMAQKFGIEDAQYNRLTGRDPRKRTYKIPPLLIMDAVAVGLGAAADPDNDEERRQWRQFILGKDRSLTQDTLIHFFDKEPADVTALRDTERSVAIGNFFKLLMDYHGLAEGSQLAYAAAQKAGKGKHVADIMTEAMHQAAVPEKYAGKPDAIDHAKPLRIGLSRSHAEIIARFAFPQNPQLQGSCTDFLDAGKHKSKEMRIRKWRATMEIKKQHLASPGSGDVPLSFRRYSARNVKSEAEKNRRDV